MDLIPREHWEDYHVNVSVPLARRVASLLRDHGFPDVGEDDGFDWHDDAIIPAKWMFPDGTPPATVVSLNARFDPVFHAKIGQALRPLRKEGILICGTGGAVHNLYRNNWFPMLTKGDNFQPHTAPAKWAAEFDKSLRDVIATNAVRILFSAHSNYRFWLIWLIATKGMHLLGSLIRLTHSPRYKEAHPTDDHYLPLVVIGGAVADDNVYGQKKAQTWELQNMSNAQYVWGSWAN